MIIRWERERYSRPVYKVITSTESNDDQRDTDEFTRGCRADEDNLSCDGDDCDEDDGLDVKLLCLSTPLWFPEFQADEDRRSTKEVEQFVAPADRQNSQTG